MKLKAKFNAVILAIFSVGFFAAALYGPFIGAAMDRFGVRWVLTLGGLVISAGLALATQASQLWHLYLTLGVSILVAIVQGFLGGMIFWALGIHAPVLWGVVMAFLSLLPAVGASIVWFPVAVYLIATGEIGKGLILMAFGAGVIGLVDNLMRPYLVGKDTALPDYVVLISTLGGIALLGLNGLVVGPLIAALFIAVWDIAARAHAAQEADAHEAIVHEADAPADDGQADEPKTS